MRTRLLTFAALALCLLLPLRAAAENVQADPTDWNYGAVMVGAKLSMNFTITSTGPTPLRVYSVEIVDDEDAVFDIYSIIPDVTFPHTLDVGETLVIAVDFLPDGEGMFGASQEVVSDAVNYPILYVPLQGEGVVVDPTPVGLMDYTVAFYYSGVANGTILGVGTGKRAEKRIDRFSELIEESDDLIDAGEDAAACEPLNDALLRIDGIARPSDWLVGPAVPTLGSLITLVMDALGCP